MTSHWHQVKLVTGKPDQLVILGQTPRQMQSPANWGTRQRVWYAAVQADFEHSLIRLVHTRQQG